MAQAESGRRQQIPQDQLPRNPNLQNQASPGWVPGGRGTSELPTGLQRTVQAAVSAASTPSYPLVARDELAPQREAMPSGAPSPDAGCHPGMATAPPQPTPPPATARQERRTVPPGRDDADALGLLPRSGAHPEPAPIPAGHRAAVTLTRPDDPSRLLMRPDWRRRPPARPRPQVPAPQPGPTSVQSGTDRSHPLQTSGLGRTPLPPKPPEGRRAGRRPEPVRQPASGPIALPPGPVAARRAPHRQTQAPPGSRPTAEPAWTDAAASRGATIRLAPPRTSPAPQPSTPPPDWSGSPRQCPAPRILRLRTKVPDRPLPVAHPAKHPPKPPPPRPEVPLSGPE